MSVNEFHDRLDGRGLGPKPGTAARPDENLFTERTVVKLARDLAAIRRRPPGRAAAH